MILHTKQDVIELAAKHAPTSAIARSLREKGAAVYRVKEGYVVRASRSRLIQLWANEPGFNWLITVPKELPPDATLVKGERL